ncbi:MAG: 5-(carboxyamino)imidazole ribonucleotide synthase [Magnetovibrionaceae bacterium]
MKPTPSFPIAEAKAPEALAPGSTIGIIGGGQLGRMTALAAAELGYDCHIFTPESDSPAARVAKTDTVAAYDDRSALEAFAREVDVVTFEFENIPFESVQLLEDLVPVRPGWDALRVSQDRLVEKEFLNSLGIETAEFRAVGSLEDLARATIEVGRPSILKTRRMGYDGKGQVRIDPDTDLAEAIEVLGGTPGILEGFVPFACEVSVVVARSIAGEVRVFACSENDHRHHILHTSTVPAGIAPELAARAEEFGLRVARGLSLVGLVALELFVTQDGRLIANEIAPRPHNSGHWTMDACAQGQFHQFVRAVAGLPLASPERHSDVVMTNLIGDDMESWPALLAETGAIPHFYGKREARKGRKMGHVNRLMPKKG